MLPRIPLLLTVSALTLLGTLELGVRAFRLAPGVHRLRTGVLRSGYELSSNPRLAYVFKKNYRDLDGPDLHESFPSTNSHGQRDIERRFERDPRRFRVLMLGDSVVAGHGVRELEDTLPLTLERQLGADVEVLNFGVGGYCTAGEVELLRTEGVLYNPDLVVLVFVNNDYVPVNGQAASYTYERPGGVEALFHHSAFFRYVSLQTDFLHFREQVDPKYWIDRNARHLGQGGLKDAFSELKGLSDARQFALLTAIWPTFSDDTIHDDDHPASGGGQLLVESILESVGIRSARLSPAYRAEHADRCARTHAERGRCATPKSLYSIGDGIHPSGLGAVSSGQCVGSDHSGVSPALRTRVRAGCRLEIRQKLRCVPTAVSVHDPFPRGKSDKSVVSSKSPVFE